MNQLSDAELNDIGLGRGDIYSVAHGDPHHKKSAQVNHNLEGVGVMTTAVMNYVFSPLSGIWGSITRTTEIIGYSRATWRRTCTSWLS